MFVGVLQVELRLEQARSLKQKRQVVRSLLERTKGSFNVSAAEIGRLDAWRDALVGFAAVSNDAAHARGLLQQVLNRLRAAPQVCVVDARIEVF